LTKANPRPEAAQISIVLRHRIHHVDDFSVEKAEVARINRDVGLSDRRKSSIEQKSGSPLEPSFAFALSPLRVDDVEAVAPFREKRVDQLGWVLQVSVDDYRALSAR